MKRTRHLRMGTNATRMTSKTRKTKRKKTFSTFLEFFRHPFPPLDHPNMRGLLRFAMLVLVLAPGAFPVTGDEKRGDSHAHNFVIFGNVFTQQCFLLPGARVSVRRTDEQKFRWEAISDRRGELGVRVKQGAEYELKIEAHGFKSQGRKTAARHGK